MSLNTYIKSELIEMSEEHYIDKDYLINALVKYMSVAELNDMCTRNEIPHDWHEAIPGSDDD